MDLYDEIYYSLIGELVEGAPHPLARKKTPGSCEPGV